MTRLETFSSARAFREWLAAHHETTRELLLRCYKTHAGDKGLTYPEAVEEALCFGWIDGVRRSVDSQSFSVRFTPRKAEKHLECGEHQASEGTPGERPNAYLPARLHSAPETRRGPGSTPSRSKPRSWVRRHSRNFSQTRQRGASFSNSLRGISGPVSSG